MTSTSPDRYASLKAHKALPRRKQAPDNTSVDKGIRYRHTRSLSTQTKKEEISSWITNASQVVANPNQYLPLTPPALPQDYSKEVSVKAKDVEPSISNDILAQRDSTQSTTPVNHQSPPTPDLTPPRSKFKPSTQTPPHTLRYPSSKADSFTTAREHFSSDDDNKRRHTSPSQLPCRQRGTSNLAIPRDVGLGLDLALEDENKAPMMQMPRIVPAPLVVEECWSSEPRVVNDDPYLRQESAAVQEAVFKAKQYMPCKKVLADSWTGKSSPEDFQASLEKSLLPQGRNERKKHGAIANSTEDLVERLTSLNGNGQRADCSDLPDINQRRLSQLSATSTVVEAMVLETPPRRRQRLRHSSKNPSLRAAGSSLSGSNRSSLVSTEAKPRLLHKKARITERGNRTSINSDSGVSTGLDLGQLPEDEISTSKVPERRSSLRPATAEREIRPLRRSQNLDKNTLRPATAPDGSMGYHELAQHKPRAMSASVPSSRMTDYRGRRILREFHPAVPTRTSSLSAPTSKNASRTTSLTSTSLHKHNIQQSLKLDQHDRSLETSKERTASPHAPEKRTSEDLLGGLRPSSMLTRTPFSALSMQSSTPGPIEVSEATAISIYPHNNKSLLVVQQTSSRGSEPARLKTSITENVRIAINPTEPLPTLQVNPEQPSSPLRNPRKAPRTPAVMLIPPTPFSRTSTSDDASTARGRNSNRDIPSANGPFSRVKRALSARRYAETIVKPLTRSLSLSRQNSLGGAGYRIRQREATDDENEAPNSKKLSPFWRPRGFWNDLEDEADWETHGVADGGERTYVRNTLGLPQARVMAGPTDLARRIGSLRRRKQQQDKTFGFTTDTSGTMDHAFASSNYKAEYDSDKKPGVMAKFENAVRGAGSGGPFSSIQDAVERIRAKRVEERLEKQRERLKRNIGPVIMRDDARPLY